MHTHIETHAYKHNSCQDENKMKQSNIKLTSRHGELGEKNHKRDSLWLKNNDSRYNTKN